jgi:hypothetical protein
MNNFSSNIFPSTLDFEKTCADDVVCSSLVLNELFSFVIYLQNELIIEQPRARRQTTRYGNQDLLNMSELDTTSESSNDEDGNNEKIKGKKGKSGRKKKKLKVDLDAENTPVEDGVYSRGEFFKVEKNLLVYGWGRWEDILLHGRFKRKLQMKDVQNITRALVSF